MQHNFVFQLTFYLFQDKIKKLSLTIIQNSDIIQIHSRHGSHSDIHSKFKYIYSLRYTSDTTVILILIQNSNPNYSLRYTPDTEVILLLIQTSRLLKIVYGFSKHGC